MGAIYSEPDKYTVSTQTPLTRSQVRLCHVLPPEVVREKILLMTSKNNTKREKSGGCFKNKNTSSVNESEHYILKDEGENKSCGCKKKPTYSPQINLFAQNIKKQSITNILDEVSIEEEHDSNACCIKKKNTYPPPIVRTTRSHHSKISDLLHNSPLMAQQKHDSTSNDSSMYESAKCCATNKQESGPCNVKPETNTCVCEEEERNVCGRKTIPLEANNCKMHDIPKTPAQTEPNDSKNDKNLCRRKCVSMEEITQVPQKEHKNSELVDSCKINEQVEKQTQIGNNAKTLSSQVKQKFVADENMDSKEAAKCCQKPNDICMTCKQSEMAPCEEENENVFKRPSIQKSRSHESFLKISEEESSSCCCSSNTEKIPEIDDNNCKIHDYRKANEQKSIIQREKEDNLCQQEKLPQECTHSQPQCSFQTNEQKEADNLNKANFCNCTTKQHKSGSDREFYSKTPAESNRYSTQEIIRKTPKQAENEFISKVQKSTTHEMLPKPQPKENNYSQERDCFKTNDQNAISPQVEQISNTCSCSVKEELMMEKKVFTDNSIKSSNIENHDTCYILEQGNLAFQSSSTPNSMSHPSVLKENDQLSNCKKDGTKENSSKIEQDVKFCNCPIKRDIDASSKGVSISNFNTSTISVCSSEDQSDIHNQSIQRKLRNEVKRTDHSISAPYTNKRSKSFSNETNANEFNNFEVECLNEHNRFRDLHNSPPVQLCSKLSQLATIWANNISRSKTIRRDDQNKFGENMYIAVNMNIHGSTPVQSWYNEINKFDFENPAFHPNTGHFTQVIWKDTKEIGVGVVTKEKTTWVVVYYNPPGNLVNKFNFNVFPPC